MGNGNTSTYVPLIGTCVKSWSERDYGMFDFRCGTLLALSYQLFILLYVIAYKLVNKLNNELQVWICEHFINCVHVLPNMKYNEMEPRMCKWKFH